MSVENSPSFDPALPAGAAESRPDSDSAIHVAIESMGAAERATLGQAIVDTVREPLIVLDETMHVLKASRSFYRTFEATPEDTEGRTFFALGNGQWNIPALRHRLAEIL